jgi:Fe-S cluster biogenesis protein NfuA
VEGVIRVFAGQDFISVTKAEGCGLAPYQARRIWARSWIAWKATSRCSATPSMTAMPLMRVKPPAIVKEIKDVIDTRVRPAVARDGGDIVFHSYDEGSGVVQLHMRGACAGCPSSTLTLKQGIENLLKHYVPEVSSVEAVL